MTMTYFTKLRSISNKLNDICQELDDFYMYFYSDHFGKDYRNGAQFGNKLDELDDITYDIENISNRLFKLASMYKGILSIEAY